MLAKTRSSVFPFKGYIFFIVSLLIYSIILNIQIWGNALQGWIDNNKAFDFIQLIFVLFIISSFANLIKPKTISPQIKRIIKIIIVIFSIFIYLRYFYWRLTQTLVLDLYQLPFIAGLLALEFVSLVNILIQTPQAFSSINRSKQADIESLKIIDRKYNPSLDILIPTYDEPVEVLRRTIIGSQNINYLNKKIYVLDDGKRPFVEQLCRDMDCEYITRENNFYGKAGNLNNGLLKSEGEIILVFDADFIAMENFLERTLGFFEDEQVAMLFTPQHFYNKDNLQKNLGGDIVPNLFEIFYDFTQQAKDAYNSAICTGTSTLIRRKYLDEIGNFPTNTIVEDWVTGMRLQARGYKVLFLNELLSVGLAAESIGAYVKQRVRWAEGTCKAFFSKDNPFLIDGLTPIQRLYHFSGILFWTETGLGFFLYLSAPLLFICGIKPINTDLVSFLSFGFTTFLIKLIQTKLLFKRKVFFVGYIQDCLMSYHIFVALMKILINPKGKSFFKVTEKGLSNNYSSINLSVVYPILILFILCIYSIFKIFINIQDFSINNLFFINLLWLEFTTIVLGLTLLTCVDSTESRKAPRFILPIKYEIEILDLYKSNLKYPIHDISESGISIYHYNEKNLLNNTIYKIKIHDQLILNARMVRSDAHCTCFEYVDLDDHNLRSLIKFIYCNNLQWSSKRKLSEILDLKAVLQGLFLYPLRAKR